MKIFILIAMIFGHILDDYFLQSAFLSNGKQKSWWEKNAPQSLYRYDFIVCLLMHSMSWSFMVMLPVAWYLHFDVPITFLVFWIGNALIHLFVDHMKANVHAINLCVDQLCHMFQIIGTWCFFILS